MARDLQSIRTLSTEALRALVREGDPPERLWAIWTIALRDPTDRSLHGFDRDPAEGVRAGLCTVLASRGDVDALLVAAVADASSLVRGQACRFLCRLGSHLPDVRDVLFNRLAADPAPAVRVIVADELADLPEVQPALQAALEDAVEEVRKAIVDRMVVRSKESDLLALRARIARETSTRLRDAILEICIAQTASATLESLADAATEVVAHALRVVVRQKKAPPDSIVAVWSARREPSITRELLTLEESRLASIPLVDLMEIPLRAGREEYGPWHPLSFRALSLVLARKRALGAFPTELEPKLAALIDLLERQLAWTSADEDDEELVEASSEIRAMIALLRATP